MTRRRRVAAVMLGATIGLFVWGGLWYAAAERRFVEGAVHALDGIVAAPEAQHLLVRHVRVWDGVSPQPLARMSVEIRDGRIAAVTADGGTPPSGARIIDGTGQTLLPGLIDTHVHLMFDSGPDLLTRGPALMREWLETVRRYPEGRDAIVRRGQLKLKAGVTTMRVLGDGYYALAYRDDLARWNVVGPRVLAAGLHVNGPNGYVTGGIAASLDPDARAEAAVELKTYDDIVPELERHIARGIDVVKIATTHGDLGFADARPDLPEAWVRAIVEVSHAHGLPVTAHSYGDQGDWAAIRGGVDGIEHLVNVPHPLDSRMVEAIRGRGIVVSPTLSGSAYSVVRFLRDPALTYTDAGVVANVPAPIRRDLYFGLRLLTLPGVARLLLRQPDAMARWEAWYRHSLANTRTLYQAGVPLVFGTDTPFAFGNFHYSVTSEMRALREAGVPADEILRMATVRAARVLGLADRVGTIEAGKVADLVMVPGDPLADLGVFDAVTLVVKEGRVVYGRPSERR